MERILVTVFVLAIAYLGVSFLTEHVAQAMDDSANRIAQVTQGAS